MNQPLDDHRQVRTEVAPWARLSSPNGRSQVKSDLRLQLGSSSVRNATPAALTGGGALLFLSSGCGGARRVLRDSGGEPLTHALVVPRVVQNWFPDSRRFASDGSATR